MAAFQFIIDGEKQRAGTALFRKQMEEAFAVGLSVKGNAYHPFSTQVKGYSGQRLRFAALRFTPHTTCSPHGMGQRSRLVISLHREGVAIVHQNGRETRIEPDDLFIIDPAQPFFIEAGNVLAHSLYIEHGALRAIMPEIELHTARRICTTDGAGAVLRHTMDQLVVQADRLSDMEADRLADALPFLVVACLAGSESGTSVPPSRLRALHKQRIKDYVRDHLQDHEMNASRIAAAVNLSTRYVYELFEDEEVPLMKWIWQTRLERCRADLASPSLRARSIGEIAYFWGFNDITHFSRTFRQRYGTSPRAFRKAAFPADQAH
ncbi:helix-turn-helix domain-containing protein [Pigmentiphaga sp.]|jgi:AraC-type DNA-binding domain-containing proteins|uniref:helix-turn-helix domain-containing protein n=1 Tax=Pigmentiphaga sp. TaxID=1977564 RepID=UPI0025E86586|nr:helix-turn-helix domain-containing protein [Pigmentiphaga sp.]MBX6316988.1 helix-turn-helix domain-containing protein [Pigmentiphaga sp.]